MIWIVWIFWGESHSEDRKQKGFQGARNIVNYIWFSFSGKPQVADA
jgi:hypothetical protein